MSWEGKQVLITGPSGDLGQAMVRKFLKEGAIVTAQYNRRLEPLQRLVEEMELAKERIVLEQADLTSPQEVRELFERLSARTEGLDLLVNNAGGARPVKFESLSLEEWQQAVNLNLTAPYKRHSPCFKKSRAQSSTSRRSPDSPVGLLDLIMQLSKQV